MTDLLKKNSALFISFSILIICYAFLASNPHPFDSDKPFIIDIWKGVFSWADYQEMKHNIIDIQPVRDLYFWMVVNISDNLFIFLNAFIWLFTITIFSKIFSLGKQRADILILVLLGLHPVAIWSIMWPSAAKHLLSLLFISISIVSCFNIKEGFHLRYKIRTLLFYFLSLFTQPIFLLFPIFIFSHLRTNWRKHKSFILLMSLVFITGLTINWYYYNITYVEQTGSEKTMAFSDFSFALNLLGFSRSLTQIFLPIQNAFYYSPASILNLIGIPLACLITLIAFLEKRVKSLSYLLFLLLPLALIYFKATNIFVSDTYLLLPIFILVPLLKYFKKNLIISLYCFFIITLGLREIFYLSQPGQKLEVSYNRVPSCKNGILLSAQQLYKIQISKFKKTASQVMKNECLLSGLNASSVIMDIYTANLFFDDSKTVEQKVQLIGDNKIDTPLIELITDKLKGNLKEDYNEQEVQKDLFNYIRNFKSDL